MTQPDIYLLGRNKHEEERLKQQIADLAPDSDEQLSKIGIRLGERVVDIGCGPGGVLHLLGKRVGPNGSVLGIERSAHFVDSARRFVSDMGLTQVEVREGDAYPHNMILAVPDRVTSGLRILHTRTVASQSPKGEGFTDPKGETLNAGNIIKNAWPLDVGKVELLLSSAT